MQRWFFLEDPNNELLRSRSDSKSTSLMSGGGEHPKYPPRSWLFRARVFDLKKNEVVCVTGSVPELGSWQAEKCIPLNLEDEDSGIWSRTIEIPDRQKVEYRYCICVIIDSGVQVWISYLTNHFRLKKYYFLFDNGS